jgi:hypothetical protein
MSAGKNLTFQVMECTPSAVLRRLLAFRLQLIQSKLTSLWFTI